MSDKQNTLWDMGSPDMTPKFLAPTDPNVRPEDTVRLSEQCQRILDMLRSGPKTNAELAAVALKYTSRLSDLRHHGYEVRVIERRQGGIVLYGLFVNGELVGANIG